MKNVAILTSDLQYAAANKNDARKKAVRAFLPRLVEFLEFARRQGVPVVHLQLVVPKGDPRAVGVPEELRFEEGTRGATLLEEVYQPSDKVVGKPKDSGFFGTQLDELLRSMGIARTVLTGMQAQICIQTTAADAYFRGYEVYVPADGVVSTVESDMNRALEWMGGYCATITTLADLERQLAAGESSVVGSQRAGYGL